MLIKSAFRRLFELCIEKITHKMPLSITLSSPKHKQPHNHLNCYCMKNYALFFVAIGSICSYSCFAQGNTNGLTDLASGDEIIAYHVEERINRPMGSSITTYEVSNLSLVHTNDLGMNNTRIVTPKYGKVRAKATALTIEAATASEAPKTSIIATNVAPIKAFIAAPAINDKVVIDVVGTYERVMDKGYKSVDMLIKVADRHFFEGDLVLSAKWYAELFATKNDLEAVYYYRYAQSLKAINQNAKAAEMMKIFETKSL